MHARLTRYEVAPENIDENLRTKRQVLPTEPGQTDEMKGVVFLTDRENGTIVVISIWEDDDAMQASEDEAARVREEVTGPGETASVERYEVSLLEVIQPNQAS
jgi:hypothetical protein